MITNQDSQKLPHVSRWSFSQAIFSLTEVFFKDQLVENIRKCHRWNSNWCPQIFPPDLSYDLISYVLQWNIRANLHFSSNSRFSAKRHHRLRSTNQIYDWMQSVKSPLFAFSQQFNILMKQRSRGLFVVILLFQTMAGGSCYLLFSEWCRLYLPSFA